MQYGNLDEFILSVFRLVVEEKDFFFSVTHFYIYEMFLFIYKMFLSVLGLSYLFKLYIILFIN